MAKKNFSLNGNDGHANLERARRDAVWQGAESLSAAKKYLINIKCYNLIELKGLLDRR